MLKSSLSLRLFFLDLFFMLFICFHHFLGRGLKVIVPLGRQLSVSFVSLSPWFQHKQKTVGVDSDGSARQQGTGHIKENTKRAHKTQNTLGKLGWDVQHLLNTVNSCPHYHPHPPWLAQPTGISKKNRLARHDAALGSETQPTPAGSESGTDEEKGGE